MSQHPLEQEYSLTATELLDAMERRFRAKVTLEGAVAEVHLGKKIRALCASGALQRYQEHDRDGYPDYTVWVPGRAAAQLIECKNVRDACQAYRQGGREVAYKVETQKTRTSNDEPATRFYDADHFHILAVCLGKKSRRWSDFMFIRSRHLQRHSKYAQKLAVMHRVPLPNDTIRPPWYTSLESLIRAEPI